jgi:hypothetical protein
VTIVNSDATVTVVMKGTKSVRLHASTVPTHWLPIRRTHAKDSSNHNILKTRHQKQDCIIRVPYLGIVRIDNRWDVPRLDYRSHTNSDP